MRDHHALKAVGDGNLQLGTRGKPEGRLLFLLLYKCSIYIKWQHQPHECTCGCIESWGGLPTPLLSVLHSSVPAQWTRSVNWSGWEKQKRFKKHWKKQHGGMSVANVILDVSWMGPTALPQRDAIAHIGLLSCLPCSPFQAVLAGCEKDRQKWNLIR